VTALPPDNDLSKLDPVFRERVEEVLRRMRVDGFDAIVWEAHRSFERAEQLARVGTGIAKSMHCYGLAADIVPAKPPHWGPPATFWAALRRHIEALGCTSGMTFTRRHAKGDLDHMQALPASCDAWVRNATAAEIAERVALELDATSPDRRDTIKQPSKPPGGHG
jgi:hypothetical protein